MRVFVLTSCLFGVVFFLSAGLVAAQEKTSNPLNNEQKGIQYESGGGTLAEKSAMQGFCDLKKYNLKVVFKATARRYLKEMKVAVQDTAGKTILSVDCKGPWFFAKLPEGEYLVRASVMGHEQVKKVVVTGELKTLEFQWQPKTID